MLDVCRRIQWSRQITTALDVAASNEMKTDLQTVMKSLRKELKTLTGAMRVKPEGTRTPLRAAQLAYLTATLVELRDITAALMKDNPTSRCVWTFTILYYNT